jgi:hypothetical protein
VAVSVVHYLDNYFNYEAFPTTDRLPAPSAGLIGVAWFVFTAAGLLGFVLYRQRSAMALACVLLAFYSLSGLVGVGHYAAPEMLEAPWWRQAHVIADIACGIAMLAFVVVSWRRWREAGPL